MTRKFRLMAIVMCFIIFMTQARLNAYSSEPPSDWAREEVNRAIELNFVPSGLQSGYKESVTRLEFTKLVMQYLRSLHETDNTGILKKFGKSGNNGFSDIQDEDVITARALGIVAGVSEAEFRPHEKLNRAAAAVMLMRVALFSNIKPNAVPKGFEDAGEFPDWARDAVAFITCVQDKAGNRVMSDYNGRFNPASDYTVEQSIATIYRIYNSVIKEEPIQAVKQWSMVFVEGGEFVMGSNISVENGTPDDPPHNVKLNDFYISDIEVTQKDFESIMGFNPSSIKGDSLPVHNVTWYDTVYYCVELSEKLGLKPVYNISGIEKNDNGNIISAGVETDWTADGYRLPTEAEWIYAASGGIKTEHYKFAGGDDLDSVAWYDANAGTKAPEKGPRSVASKLPNELNLYDMTGNVSEWCYDYYDAKYFTKYEDTADNPKGPETGEKRIRYGGNWITYPEFCVLGVRGKFEPEKSLGNLGFRIARSYEKEEKSIGNGSSSGGTTVEIQYQTISSGGRTTPTPPISMALVYVEGSYGVLTADIGISLEALQGGLPDMASIMKYGPATPLVSVGVSPFYMGKYEVTQREFMAVMGYNPSRFNSPGKENHPVEKVTWHEAVEFCNRLSDMSGLDRVYLTQSVGIIHTGPGKGYPCECEFGINCIYKEGQPAVVDMLVKADYTKNGYRLPTEVEWEYAAKGGRNKDSYNFSGSDNLDEVSWHAAYTDPFRNIRYEANADSPQEIGLKKPNSLDIYDMTGNVSEWCFDRNGLYEGSSGIYIDQEIGVISGSALRIDPTGNPAGPNKWDVRHILRGGNFMGGVDSQYDVFYRYSRSAHAAINICGFRVVRSVVDAHISDMALIDGGTFTMGTKDNTLPALPRLLASGAEVLPDRKADGVKVALDNFYMQRYQVTQSDFESLMGFNPAYFKNPYAPVEQVTWYDAIAYCIEKNKMYNLGPLYTLDNKVYNESGSIISADVSVDWSQYGFRLPTEAEWIFAARGGMKSLGNLPPVTSDGLRYEYEYSGSAAADEVAWRAANSGGQTHTVGQLKPNEAGLYDMSGNVSEWCFDWYDSNYSWLRLLGNGPVKFPTGIAAGSEKVILGGSFSGTNGDVSIKNSQDFGEPLSKRALNPAGVSNEVGFRTVYYGPRVIK